MKKIIFVCCLGISLFCFQNCDSEENDCQVICGKINAAPQELLDFFVFKKGSYWVYQLNGTDTIDTMRFTGMDAEYFELKGGCNLGISPCEMRYRVFFNHSNLIKFPIAGSGVSNERYSILYSQIRDQWDVTHVSGSRGLNGSLGFFLSYPLIIDQQYEEGRFLKDTSVNVIVPAGSFICNEIEIRSGVISNGLFKSMNWCNGIGLVKFIISPNQTWELINYHIE